MIKIFSYILCLSFLGCSGEPENFLVDKFFKDLTKTITNKSQLEEFKSLPLDSAVMNHTRFDDIFQKAINTMLEDSLYRSRFESSFLTNNLSLTNIGDSYVLAAMYHKSLNHLPIHVVDLKGQYYPMYLRKQILEQDNSISTAVDSDCFVKELGIIRSWLEDSMDRIEYLDADLILNASNPDCNKNVEYRELYNETLFKYLEKKPNEIVELLQLGNYGEVALNVILENVQSPINDGIDIDRVIESIQNLENSEIKEKLLISLRIAKSKYDH